MILIGALLIAFLVLVAAIVIRVIFNPAWQWLNRVIIALGVLSLVLALGVNIGCGVAKVNTEDIQEHYDTIMLYYDIIDTSRNEYVRFDFYNRVQDYNAEYEDFVEKTESIWGGAFYSDEWVGSIAPIDFMLIGSSHN